MDAGSSSIRPEDKKRKAQGPPESARPHGAKQGTASARYTLGKARSVDVVGFVEARAFEINALQRSLENARSAGNTRAFQTLPRHLRRRAASHNVKRLPARLREKALAEMKKSAQTSKALAGTDRLTNAQTSSRYKRRRARATREEYELRQAGKRWLETHVWHAKRMRMKELWGTMVAETPNERSHRAAYRAAKEKTYIQDVSYFNTLELTGSEEAIVDVLRPLLPPDGMTILMKPYATGARMAPLTLYRAGMYPLAALGPAMALWQPVSSTEQRKLWLRVHPANANAVKAELEQAVEDRSQLEDQSVRIADITCDLVSFELLGGQSTQLLATVLAQSTDLGACGASVLQLIRALPNPAVLPESVVIALQIHDPRLEFPFKADPAHASLSADEQQRLHEILLRWPVDAAILDRQQPSAGIWDREECAKSLARRQSEQALNQRRKQQLIPGMKLKPDPSIDVAVPLLLVRTGPEAQLGSRTGRMDRQYIDTLAHGWTLVAPRGWGMPLWMALNFAGARAQGLNECHHVGFEAGLPTFPANWPGTSAYNAWDGAAATAAYQKWMRRPPGKRVNYLKFGIESPFYAPFRQLLGLPGMPEAYPRISADGLECRMKRLRKVASKKKEAKANGQTSAGCAVATNTAAEPMDDIWLMTGESSMAAVGSMLSSPRSATHGPTPPAALAEWAAPLLDAARVTDCNSRSNADIAGLLERCLVRVRLLCSGRGVPAANAPICIESTPATEDSEPNNAIGYVMTSSFSLARGCGMAIGACSLRGLFRLWSSAAEPVCAKSPRVTIRSIDGGPSISAALVILA
ncbi:Ribonucleases P/MRP protein subunit pop1 [Coemansia sp. RSA 2711]|nr:Ribonucleases P/MRP protein subunit pop1 [Coemansia sp. RSA 2711]KAJ2314864.1 Ribonucleases P/MRP protein subunit pop1 [Coemansia sp. RSA 2705]